jgi:site-specific recombinase XerC
MDRRRRQMQTTAELLDDSWAPAAPPSSSRQNDLGHELPPDSVHPHSTSFEEPFPVELEKISSTEYGRSLALYYSLMQNSRMTFLEFVKTRFIPQHVMFKGPAGRRHYHAMLKHILKPETVDSLFDSGAANTNKSLAALPGWPYLDNVQLCDLQSDHVRTIMSAALDMGYSVQTVKHIRNVIGNVITHATNRRCFSGGNPAFEVPLPRMIRKQQGELTVAQVKQLLAVMKYPEKEIALVAIFAGLNMLEICGLQWKSVNLGEVPRDCEGSVIPPRCIAVTKQLDAGHLVDVRGNRRRNVEMTEILLTVFRRLHQSQLRVQPDDFIFVSRPGSPLWPANLQLRLKSLGRDLDMSWLSWHLFTKMRKTIMAELTPKSTFGNEPGAGL